MPFCVKCGKDAGSNNYCGACGTQIPDMKTLQQSEEKNKKKLYCTGAMCDDTGYYGTIHSKDCPLSENYKPIVYTGYP